MTEYKDMTEEDLKGLYAFAAPIWKECYQGVLPEGQIDLLTHKYFDYANILSFRQAGMIYESISYEGKPAGFLAFRLHEDFTYLDKIYLKQEFRGKHISSETFESLLQRYRKPLRLNVNQGNKLGMRAYQGQGFRIVEEKRYDLPNGYVNCDYIMEKPLPEEIKPPASADTILTAD